MSLPLGVGVGLQHVTFLFFQMACFAKQMVINDVHAIGLIHMPSSTCVGLASLDLEWLLLRCQCVTFKVHHLQSLCLQPCICGSFHQHLQCSLLEWNLPLCGDCEGLEEVSIVRNMMRRGGHCHRFSMNQSTRICMAKFVALENFSPGEFQQLTMTTFCCNRGGVACDNLTVCTNCKSQLRNPSSTPSQNCFAEGQNLRFCIIGLCSKLNIGTPAQYHHIGEIALSKGGIFGSVSLGCALQPMKNENDDSN